MPSYTVQTAVDFDSEFFFGNFLVALRFSHKKDIARSLCKKCYHMICYRKSFNVIVGRLIYELYRRQHYTLYSQRAFVTGTVVCWRCHYL